MYNFFFVRLSFFCFLYDLSPDFLFVSLLFNYFAPMDSFVFFLFSFAFLFVSLFNYFAPMDSLSFFCDHYHIYTCPKHMNVCMRIYRHIHTELNTNMHKKNINIYIYICVYLYVYIHWS